MHNTLKIKRTLAWKVRSVIFTFIVLNIFLIIFGQWLVPTAISASTEGKSGLIAALMIQLVYFAISFFFITATERLNIKILKYSLLVGFTVGFVLALQMLSQYTIPLNGEIKIGSVALSWEYPLSFLLYFLVGLWSAIKTKKYLPSILTSFWGSIIASLIWLSAVLLIYYSFHGTNQQLLVLKAEGDFEDFKRSGMTDFEAFIIQDFWGAGFFHLLLMPIIASILGALGGLFGLLFLKLIELKSKRKSNAYR